MTASFFLSDSAPKEVKQALLELLETDANFRIALRAALRSTTPSPLASTQLPSTTNNNTNNNNTNNSNNTNTNSNAAQMNSFASSRDGSKSYLSALAAVSKRKNSLQRSGTAAPTSPAPAPSSVAPTPPAVAAAANASASALSPKQKVLRRVKRRSVSRGSPNASPSTTMNLPPPPLPSDDEHSDNNDTDDHDDTHHNHHHHHHHNLVHHPAPNTTTANNATISAAVVVASTDSSSKATTNNTNTKITTAANTNTNNNNNNNNNKNGSLEFDDVSSGDSDSSDGAPLPPPGHVPPPLPDSETPPLPDSSLLGPTPPLPPDRSVPSVPPVLPPVTSPQDTLTQTTSTTAARSCSGCALSIAPEEKHYEFRMSDEEVFYHVACFACIDCGMALEPQTFKTRGAAVYCATHFAERFFPRCGGCNEPITTDVFSVALGKSWHKGHFKCFECGKQLQTDFVADELQRPFCDAECFDEHNDNEENDNDDNDDDQDDDNDVHEDMDD